MNFYLYDDEYAQWGKVVTEHRLGNHDDKKASTTVLGHIKVDGATITIDTDGVISVDSNNLTFPIANLTTQGIVRLSSAIDSASESEAATSKAVMDAIADIELKLNNKISDLIGHTDTDFDTLKELLDYIENLESAEIAQLLADMTNKADKTYVDTTFLKTVDVDSSKTIVFVVTDVIKQGLQKAHITIPFTCTLDGIDATVMKSGNDDLEIQIQKTTNFSIWTNVLDSPITITNGTNKSTINSFTNAITFNEGDILTLDVLTDSKCENLSVNLKVTKQ